MNVDVKGWNVNNRSEAIMEVFCKGEIAGNRVLKP